MLGRTPLQQCYLGSLQILQLSIKDLCKKSLFAPSFFLLGKPGIADP